MGLPAAAHFGPAVLTLPEEHACTLGPLMPFTDWKQKHRLSAHAEHFLCHLSQGTHKVTLNSGLWTAECSPISGSSQDIHTETPQVNQGMEFITAGTEIIPCPDFLKKNSCRYPLTEKSIQGLFSRTQIYSNH